MQQITIEIPDDVAQGLSRLALEHGRPVEQEAAEQLAVAIQTAERSLAERYEDFIRESGLFRQVSDEERQRYEPVSEERLLELAEKLGKAGPLSEVIIEERGPR